MGASRGPQRGWREQRRVWTRSEGLQRDASQDGIRALVRGVSETIRQGQQAESAGAMQQSVGGLKEKPQEQGLT